MTLSLIEVGGEGVQVTQGRQNEADVEPFRIINRPCSPLTPRFCLSMIKDLIDIKYETTK